MTQGTLNLASLESPVRPDCRRTYSALHSWVKKASAWLQLSGLHVAASGKGPGDKEKAGNGTPMETVEVQWSEEVRAFTARLLLRDGLMQMSRDLGWVSV